MRFCFVWFSLLCTVILLSDAPAHAGVGEWKTFTSKREIRSIALQGTTLWAATSGGLFSYDTLSGSYAEFTTSDGLRTIDLTAVTVDRDGNIWMGASDGFLQSYEPRTRTWRSITDIALLSAPSKRINALRPRGDTLYILSDIGVSVYAVAAQEFRDSYTRFGVPPNQLTGPVVAMEEFQNSLWVATRSGIAAFPLANPNPASPSSWQIFTTAQGLPSATVTSLLPVGDMLFAGTAAGLAYHNGDLWETFAGTAGINILAAAPVDCRDCGGRFITSSQLWSFASTAPPVLVADGFTSPLTTLAEGDIIGSASDGLLLPHAGTWVPTFPPGPPSNKFIGLAVDQRGILWAGTGIANSDGFMRFDGHAWKSYSAALDPRLGTNTYYKISIGRDNIKWVSSWGNGVVLLDDGGTLRKVLNTQNGLPPSIDPAFVVVGGTATDRFGTTWITNRTGRGDTAVVLFKPDSTLRYIVGLPTRNPSNVFTDVVIDFNDTKWFANFSRFEPERALGLYYYNENIALPGTSGGWGKLTTTDRLTSDQVWSLAIDRDGALWIGSNEGVSIIFDPSNPRTRMAQYHPLQDQIIQAIVVDPLNNKWLGTRQGVFVLSPDGTSIIARYTRENTENRLLDNDVAALAIDPTSGYIYCGTEKGLSRLSTSAVEPQIGFSDLTLRPNPFYLPSGEPLTVDGLVEGSILKVLRIDGALIREIRTPGGRVGSWDGRNAEGELVATGIYLVVAYSEDGKQTATGKVAVVRR